MTSLNHNQHRSAQGRTGGVRWAAVHPAHIRADQCQCGRSHSRSVGDTSRLGPAIHSSCLADCLTVSPVTRPGGLASLPGYGIHIRTAGGRCIGIQRRRAGGFLLPSLVRRKFSAALLIGGSHQLNRIGQKPASDIADPFHLERPSCVRVLDNRERDREGFANGRKEVVGERNV